MPKQQYYTPFSHLAFNELWLWCDGIPHKQPDEWFAGWILHRISNHQQQQQGSLEASTHAQIAIGPVTGQRYWQFKTFLELDVTPLLLLLQVDSLVSELVSMMSKVCNSPRLPLPCTTNEWP